MFVIPWNPGMWLAQNWQYVVGWAALLLFLQRLYSIARKFEKYGDKLDAASGDLVQIKDNHLAHIQAEQEKTNDKLDKTNDALYGLREDIRDGFSRLSDSINILLSRMP
jgi:hypothetical protein